MRNYTKAYKLICQYCGKSFQGKSRQKYCSYFCRKKASLEKEKKEFPLEKIKKVCPVCNKVFFAIPRHKKYCSPFCRAKSFFSSKPKEINKICPMCKKTFTTIFPDKVYCSKKCIKKNRGEKFSERKIKEKRNSKCKSCGFSDYRALQQHHINHSDRQKTIILCANCHYIYHSIVGWGKKAEAKSRNEVLEVLKLNVINERS